MSNVPAPAAPPEIPEFLLRWFRDKTPEQQQSIAAEDGRILWPDTIKVWIEAGGVCEVLCWLCVPNPIEHVQTVVEVNKLIADLFKIPEAKRPLSRKQATELVDNDESAGTTYGQLHSAILMAFCIYEQKPGGAGYKPKYLPQTIIKNVGLLALYDLYSRLELYGGLEDVRINELSPELFDAWLIRIAGCMSSAPLHGCTGALSGLIVVRMAQEVLRLRAAIAAAQAPSDSSSE